MLFMATYHELPDASLIRDTGRVSCSHSRSRELAGVDSAVLAKRARASKHCKGISRLVQDLKHISLNFILALGS